MEQDPKSTRFRLIPGGAGDLGAQAPITKVPGNNPFRVKITPACLAAAAEGDEESCSHLIDFVYTQAQLMLGEKSPEVDDTTQDVVLKVLDKVRDGTFDPAHPSHPSSWVTQVTRRHVRDHLRTSSGVERRFELEADLDEHPLLASPLDEIVDTSRSCDIVRRAYHTLRPQARMVLFLRYFEGLSVEETAEALGVPTGTVKSRTARAIDELREAYQQTRNATGKR